MKEVAPFHDGPFAFRSFVLETRSQASIPCLQGWDEPKTNPKDSDKGKSTMNCRSPSPLRIRVPYTPTKPNFPNNAPHIYFLVPTPYNVVEDLSKVPTNMALLNSLRTVAQVENMSHVFQAPFP